MVDRRRRFRRRTLPGRRDLRLDVSYDAEGVGETIQMIDGTVIRAHRCAAGAKGEFASGSRAPATWVFDRNSSPHQRSRSPSAVDIAPGRTSDQSGAPPLPEADGPEPKVLLADRGYDSDAIREAMEAVGVAPIIPMRRSRNVQIPVDDEVDALRNRIERCFERLKNRHRLVAATTRPPRATPASSSSPPSA